ncbi:MAG: putative sulfate exporter family transporter [Planctomycetaceae bacterium]|nr:putative sulfate exporter family transporter [Planctomycetaceae bacterium]
MRSWLSNEDWWAVWLGLLVVLLALPAASGYDLLGWLAAPGIWLDPAKAVGPISKSFAGFPKVASVLLTYAAVLGLVGLGASVQRFDLRRFVPGFTVIFGISYLSWLIGHYAYIAQTPDKRAAMGLSWSLGLTGEAGYIVALLAGLAIGNVLPGLAGWLKEAARPEWYIKTAIVILGASLGIKAAAASGLVSAIMFRGLAAIIEAYLIYWALVYFLARKYFKFSREWAAPLASGISICGVSAAITTGAAIRARPVVPITVSSLVVIFSVIELLVLPFAAQAFLAHEPMVAAAWMGLAVKTDGAAVASGAITDALIRGKAAGAGLAYEPGWMLTTTTTVKVFIDVFIGIWALVLAAVWVYGIEKKPGQTLPIRAIAERFPKFVLGYFFLFLALLGAALARPDALDGLKAATAQSDLLRSLFFVLTFFTIGLGANFKRLRAEGIGRLALVYVISLFGFIIWIGLAISWLFFHGVHPPTLGGS